MSREHPRDEAQVRRLLNEARTIRDWTPSERDGVGQALEAKWRSPLRPAWRWSPAMLAVGVIALLLRVTQAPEESTRRETPPSTAAPLAASKPESEIIEVGGGRARFVLAPGARAHKESDAAIALDRGQLTAELSEGDAPVVVATPFARVESLVGHFSLDVAVTRLAIAVDRGMVKVAFGDRAVVVKAGETLRTDDPPVSASLREAARSARDVAASEPTPRRGDALAAENALYARGVEAEARGDGAEALRRWRELERRFPRGELAAEASALALTELVRQRRHEDALAEADAFLRRFPAHSRAQAVELVRANLLREQLGDPRRALAGYRAVLARSTREAIREEAAFFVIVCAEELSDQTAARAALQAYLAQFPRGRHREDAERLASSLSE